MSNANMVSITFDIKKSFNETLFYKFYKIVSINYHDIHTRYHHRCLYTHLYTRCCVVISSK